MVVSTARFIGTEQGGSQRTDIARSVTYDFFKAHSVSNKFTLYIYESEEDVKKMYTYILTYMCTALYFVHECKQMNANDTYTLRLGLIGPDESWESLAGDLRDHFLSEENLKQSCAGSQVESSHETTRETFGLGDEKISK